MKKRATIIFSIIVVLLPILPFSRPGVFSGQQAALVTIIVCCVLLFFVLRRERQIQISLSDALVVLYFVCSVINIAFLQGFRVDPHLYWKWGAVGFVYAVARNVTQRRMVLVALVVAGVVQSLVAIAQKLSLLKSNHTAFEVTGTFGNPGQLAGLLCVTLVVALCLTITAWRQNNGLLQTCKHQNQTHLWYGLSALLIAGALLLADSRAALVGVVVGLVVWSWPVFSAFFRKHKMTMSIALIAVVVAAGIVLFRYKSSSANARLLVWRVGTEMAAEKPVAGYGVASFHQVYMPRQAKYFEAHPDSPLRMVADNAVYPYNEPLHLLMEQGIIGLWIMVAIFISVFTSIPLRRQQHNDKAGEKASKPTETAVPAHKPPRSLANAGTAAANHHDKTKNPDNTSHDRQIFKVALAALSVYSCFSYPSYVFGLLFLFPVLLGSLNSGTVWKFRLPGWFSVLVKVLIIVCIIQSMRLIGYYRESERMVGRLFSSNPQSQQQAQRYIAETYGQLRYNPVFNNIYAVWIGDHPEAADRLPPEQIAGMDPFCEGYCTTGNYYVRRGMYAEAERYYLTASDMIPTRLMPNYLLWRLYAAQGDTVRAATTARKALEQPLKIENDFTREAKDEMKEYIIKIEEQWQNNRK